MNRHYIALWGAPALAVAALMWLAAPALGQRGGGGHGGGGRGGGSHGGGYAGGYHGGSGYYHGYYGSGGRGYPGYYHGYYGSGGRYGRYPGFYGGFYLGGYGGGYYDNAYYFGSAGDSVAYAPEAATDYQAYYPPEQQQQPALDPNTASLTVRVPEDAEIWLDNTKMTQTGMVREFVTPALTPNADYSYQARARWTANGKVYDQTHTIHFKTGQAILVDFLTPAPGARRQPAMEKAP